ncbi:MAG TPA: DUF1156 domain-containing protein [Terriglobales bacterium]|nr:DUF1156 domain-containing protein [Terriglobales bacterium]
MIPKECKRLAEVDFPIAVVSRHSAREKSIRHGHPSTLHLWWARRPLAACRAMLMALLLPDPADPNCPEEFKERARRSLPRARYTAPASDLDLRRELLRFIGDFANWDNSANPVFLEAARGLVRAAHGQAQPGGALEYEPPLVVDPFAGGGSIPLEALRLGCDAFASDLNPVACLILKVMLEDIPRHGPGLADELRRVGAEIRAAAEKELAEFYPPDPDGFRPIAYLWARTVQCDSCGAEIPLVRSFWLCKKAKRKRALRFKVVRPKDGVPRIEFEIFEPRGEQDVAGGTVARAKATCLACRTVLVPDRVRAQLAAQRGGADVVFDDQGRRTAGARLLAVVTLKPSEQGRHYRLPNQCDYNAVWRAQRRLAELLDTEPYKRGFLAYVWETVGRLALEEVLGTAEARARNGAAGALEEDSRLTALFLWTLQSTQSDANGANGKNEDESAENESDAEDEEEEGAKAKKKKSGYTLIYDVARRFAQPLGIHLEKWEGRIIETEKGIVRLLPVIERAEQLFGEADAVAISRRIEEDAKASRNLAFSFMQDPGAAPEIKARGHGRKTAGKGGSKAEGTAAAAAPAPQPSTTLDRLHAAMLLQRSGQTNGLRALLKDEMQRGPDFLRLANALSRLYPKESEEKRLLDAMLLAVPKN